MDDLPDCGIYVLTVRLERPGTIEVGRLGRIRFGAGTYFYVGRAKRRLRQRIRRHLAREKRLHWHIDHLLQHAVIEGVTVHPFTETGECGIAGRLAREHRGVAACGFGASDCRCPGHLIRGK